jgi:hypothetical protein
MYGKVQVSKEDFKRKLQEDQTPFDVVASIIYFFGKDASFSTDYKKLHSAFYAERKNDFIKEFRFKEAGPYPYSELLESVLSRIAISGLLSCQNPDYRKYEVTTRQLDRIKSSSLKKFSAEQLEELEALSKRIKENLK